MLIREILQGGGGKPSVAVQKSMPLLEAASDLQTHDSSAVLVIDSDSVCGILSDRDLVNAIVAHGAAIALLTVGDAMDRSLITCTLDDDVSVTLDRMSAAGVHHIPVLKDGVPMTMLSSREFETACRFLKTQAETDDLTNLSNRRSFQRAVRYELENFTRNRTPVALAFLDLDLFKRINDQLGHGAGDEVLQAVARVLATESRSFDCVARIGGDEFAVLFPQTQLHQAILACRRILRSCTRLALPPVDGVFQVSLSAGVADARPGDAVEDLMKRADDSLYAAKAAGRGCVVTAPTPQGTGLDGFVPQDRNGGAMTPSRTPEASDEEAPADQALLASSNI